KTILFSFKTLIAKKVSKFSCVLQEIFKPLSFLMLMILEIIDGVFVISAGIIALILWIVVLIKRLEHKFIERPFERLFHIIAEFVMSTIAMISGIALLLQQAWGLYLFFLAMGLILYALVNAIGIYGEKNYKLLVIILVISSTIALTLIAVTLALLVF
ncbi:MAG: hypothetical protein ACW96U_08765, partial [Candidatus Heimdallarchaeaceae archaeon]